MRRLLSGEEVREVAGALIPHQLDISHTPSSPGAHITPARLSALEYLEHMYHNLYPVTAHVQPQGKRCPPVHPPLAPEALAWRRAGTASSQPELPPPELTCSRLPRLLCERLPVNTWLVM